MRPGLAWLESLGPQRIRPGLAKTRALLAALGNPEGSFRSILIGGTNGKGSTAAATASILSEAGVRAGLYTSPHLVRVNERIRVDGADVSDAALDDVLTLLAAISPSGERAPTYFEAITVAAFELFRRARVTVAVVEVGLGGRLDATNILLPEVSVVTNVALDHVTLLGPTVAHIAREKAGIFRSGRPALTAAEGEALDVLDVEARRVGARLIEVPATERFDDVSPLPGLHQRKNLALAAAAAGALVPLSYETLRRGVAATRWPGRLQTVRREGRRELLLDGAHNPDGALALAAHLDASGLSGSVDLVFGGLSDKALDEMFAVLSPRVRRVLVVAPDSARAVPAKELARRLGLEEAAAVPNLAAAVARLDASAEREGPILVTGSLVLVGDALRLHAPPDVRIES